MNFGYTYDAVGNIFQYTAPDGEKITYTYDAQGQLLKAVGDETYTYTYDSVGNILTANGHTYTYGNANWKDLLTAFDGHTITYDQSGNPIGYYNGTTWAFTWSNGRSLTRAVSTTQALDFTYDSSGLRTSKTVDGVTHKYLYAGGKLMRETYGSNTLDFFYDANGTPYALKYNGTAYYYITNLQGDVIQIVDASGNAVATYEYAPYGRVISATGTLAETNPIRYCSYYYDGETGFYYLQSRYYDPAIGRFISSDTYSSTGQGFIGHNTYAYCGNNPISRADSGGEFWHLVIGAAVGIATQYVSDVTLNLLSGKSLSDSLTQTSSLVDYTSAAIGGATYLMNSNIEGKSTNALDLTLAVGIGGVAGVIGGSGANGAKLRGVYTTSKTVLKTVVSTTQKAMYTAKVSTVMRTVAVSTARTAVAGFFSNVGNLLRKAITYSAT